MEFEKDRLRTESAQEYSTGQFIFVKDGDDEGNLILKDDEQNIYDIRSVSILSPELSSDAGNINFPKPFVTDKTGGIIETGAKVMIAFPRGRKNPVVMGCLNSLGAQYMNNYELRIDKMNLRDLTVYKKIGDTYIRRTESASGISTYVDNGGFTVAATSNIALRSESYIAVTGLKGANIGGKIVNVKGSSQTDRRNLKVQRLNDKADEINLYGKKVSIGHSNDIGADFKLDKDTDYLNPRYQNLVMGITLKILMEILIDELGDGIWMGSGTVRMSETTKLKIKLKVKEKLDKILSNVGYILYDPNQVEDESSGGIS